MSLLDKVIIEVGINENTPKAANPNVPYTPEEIAADARRCADAGASIIHYHARDPITAWMTSDIELNLRCQRLITESRPVIAYPTQGDVVSVPGTWYELGSMIPNRMVHYVAGVQQSVRFEVGPVDLAAFYDFNAINVPSSAPPPAADGIGLDPAELEIPGWTLVKGHQFNNGYDQVWLCRFFQEHGLQRSFAAPDSMALLNLRNLIDMGLVPEPMLSLKLFLWTDKALITRARAMHDIAKELFTDRDMRVTFVVQAGDGFPATMLGLTTGQDVRTGIGDYSYSDAGAPTNAELVERVVAMARAVGREPATPDEARQIKGLPLLDAQKVPTAAA